MTHGLAFREEDEVFDPNVHEPGMPGHAAPQWLCISTFCASAGSSSLDSCSGNDYDLWSIQKFLAYKGIGAQGRNGSLVAALVKKAGLEARKKYELGILEACITPLLPTGDYLSAEAARKLIRSDSYKDLLRPFFASPDLVIGTVRFYKKTRALAVKKACKERAIQNRHKPKKKQQLPTR